LTDPKNLFNSVCVKACPSTTYTAPTEKGKCVLSSNAGPGVEGTVVDGTTGDFNFITTITDFETCGKKCL